VSGPAVTITLRIEAAPRIYVDAISESEENRIVDWIRAHHGYAALVDRAIELAAREAA
jgi:hypothetical protein